MGFENWTAKQYREAAKKGWLTRKANGKASGQHHRRDGTFKVSMVGKYRNQPVHLDGRRFDSKAEAMRYAQLLEMQSQGRLDSLECQPAFPCHVNGQLVCTYFADFRYRINPGRLGQRTLIEDVKGVATDLYRIKKKLVHALYPIEIVEIPVRKTGVNIYRMKTADQI